VYGADINRHDPEIGIILASYWTTAGDVFLSAVHAMMNVIENGILNVTEPAFGRRVVAKYAFYFSVLVRRLCVYLLHSLPQ
jgi:hypothetical protein